MKYYCTGIGCGSFAKRGTAVDVAVPKIAENLLERGIIVRELSELQTIETQTISFDDVETAVPQAVKRGRKPLNK
jgi:hypothetical protein